MGEYVKAYQFKEQDSLIKKYGITSTMIGSGRAYFLKNPLTKFTDFISRNGWIVERKNGAIQSFKDKEFKEMIEKGEFILYEK